MFLYRMATWLLGLAAVSALAGAFAHVAARLAFKRRVAVWKCALAVFSGQLFSLLFNMVQVTAEANGVFKMASWAAGLTALFFGVIGVGVVLGRCKDDAGERLGFARAIASVALGVVVPMFLIFFVADMLKG